MDGSCRRRSLPHGVRPGLPRCGVNGSGPTWGGGGWLCLADASHCHTAFDHGVRGLGWMSLGTQGAGFCCFSSCQRRPLPHGICYGAQVLGCICLGPRDRGWMDGPCRRRPLPHGIRAGTQGHGLMGLSLRGHGWMALAGAGYCFTAFDLAHWGGG